ncbi:unnamed protein product [Fusarium graminearum]|nr:unnamed protein product [Fusarium graminearum]
MDPLSLAVSVVPVAEQLVKTIKTIKKLISTYKSAAKELETLTSRLGHVEVICESIGTVLETACLSKNLSEACLPTSLYQMIHECYEKVTVIHDVIQNVTEKRDRGCRRFRNEGLVFLQHKDRIIASTKGLDKSLEYLHLLLTTSIFIMSISCPPAPEVTMSNKNSPSNQSSILVAPSQKIDSNCIDTSPVSTDTTTQPKQVETISEGWRRSFLQFAFLQKTRKRNIITETEGSDHECNMLGFAAVKRAPQLLDFIRSQMTRVEETAHFGGGDWRWHTVWTQGQLQSAIDYINIRKNAITPDEVYMLLLGVWDFRQLRACMDAYLSWRPIISPALNYTILERLLTVSPRVDFADGLKVKGCASLISDIIAGGLDIFNDDNLSQSSFKLLIDHTKSPDEAVEDIHRWLDILELAGIDIEQYIRFETPRCVAAWNKPSADWHRSFRGPDSYINRTLHVGYSRGRLIPYWRDNIDKSCLLHELLMEFPHFRDLSDYRVRTNAEQNMRYHGAWKARQDVKLIGPEKHSWPVAPVLRVESQPDDPILAADITEEYRIALE